MSSVTFKTLASRHQGPNKNKRNISKMDETMKLKIEFGGGTELLFDKQKVLDLVLTINPDRPWTISRLIKHLRDHHIKERPELFSNGDKIRPGILVLVNDVDYEIFGGPAYVLKDKDNVLFISTLHGG